MSIESFVPMLEFSEKEGREKRLYPERAFLSVDQSIEKLKKIQSGEIDAIELSAEERNDILSFENELGTEFEEIYGIKVSSAAIYPEYLLIQKGKELLHAHTGIEVETDDVEEVKKIILQNRGKIASIKGAQLQEIEGQSKKYSEDELLKRMMANVNDLGEISMEGVELGRPFSVVLNPEAALDKLQKLRNFKQKLKNSTELSLDENRSKGYEDVARAIVDQYRKRVNEVIVEQFMQVVKIRLLADDIGEENLSEDEKKLTQQFAGLKNFVSMYSRFDKLVYGVEYELDGEGNYKQIGEKITAYANEAERNYIENEKTKKQKATECGLDFDKITKKNISQQVFSKYADAFLERYDKKSSTPASDYDPKRKGPAPDGKWQFVASDRFASMKVDSVQKVIKAPSRDRSIQELVTVLLGHEFTHFMQALNQDKIKLKLYNKIGGDRMEVLTEGAAMSMQKMVSEEIFGFGELPKPYYVKAMAKKINGGNYLDCVKAYYDCSLKIYLETTEKIDLSEKPEELLAAAMRSCKRLFKTGEDTGLAAAILSKSKDTVYLEQLAVMNRLREAGLEKFALVRGLNLDSLCMLLQNGFIKESDLETLDIDFIRKSWDELKGGFAFENKESN